MCGPNASDPSTLFQARCLQGLNADDYVYVDYVEEKCILITPWQCILAALWCILVVVYCCAREQEASFDGEWEVRWSSGDSAAIVVSEGSWELFGVQYQLDLSEPLKPCFTWPPTEEGADAAGSQSATIDKKALGKLQSPGFELIWITDSGDSIVWRRSAASTAPSDTEGDEQSVSRPDQNEHVVNPVAATSQSKPVAAPRPSWKTQTEPTAHDRQWF
eukprot:COSAG02_NODE_18374_length_943_cov_0.612559_2_plen_217_part_01